MKILKITLINLFLFLLVPQNLIAQNAKNILSWVEKNIGVIQLLHYKSLYLDINPAINDSIFKSTGEIWLKNIPSDSIFGAQFHVKGSDTHGNFEYFYNGYISTEIRDFDTSINIFDPYKYPNDYRNPAKARMALLPFFDLLINKNLKSTLLKNNPKLLLDSVQNNWKITLFYPKDKEGGIFTKILFIDKSKLFISKYEKILKWRGLIYRTNISISNYSINNEVDKNKIKLTGNYSGYKKKNSEELNALKSNITGKYAPDFSYYSYSGQKVTLNQYKGRVILLDFWESWCGYCLNALPEINKFYDDYRNKGVEVIGISTENKKQVKKIISYNKLNYINIFADVAILKDYKVSARPTYVLINKTGKIELVSYGDWDKVKEKINQIIN